MKVVLAVILSSFVLSNAYGTTVAVIDSGTDYKHKDLSHIMWQNEAEAPHGDNLRDEDGNGYEDDIYGWNFAESNNQVIADKYRGMLTNDMRKFFTVQEKMMRGTATVEEVDWLRSMVRNEDFIKSLSIYGNFMHGTHVAGISVKGNPDARILAVKLIPTEVSLPGAAEDEANDSATSDREDVGASTAEGGIMDKLIKKFIQEMAEGQMQLMTEIAVYVNDHKADIANGSFGTGYRQIETVFRTIIEKVLRRTPTDEEMRRYTMFFFETILAEGQKMVAQAPNTLFVFAAGNDASNNDKYPTSPTNIKADNVISVAATLERNTLASFSNYGIENVDVAAPGVGIYSTAPDDEYLSVSGTSQAAPYVAMVASLVKDNNPELTPGEIKKILMGTVDLKNWLKTKVKSSGVVNKSRAIKAAELSKSMTVEEAIQVSVKTIADVQTNKMLLGNKGVMDLDAFVLPLPSTISFGK